MKLENNSIHNSIQIIKHLRMTQTIGVSKWKMYHFHQLKDIKFTIFHKLNRIKIPFTNFYTYVELLFKQFKKNE